MTTPGEGAKKPRFVPYNAQLLAESAQELMNKCEQQKKAVPELVTTTSVTSGVPIQRGVSQDNEWESSLSNWKSKRRSSGGTYQPKVIDIDMDTGNEIPAVSDTNSKRKSTALKDLSESRGDSGGRGYLYPVDDMENIQPNKRTETRQSFTNSPRNSESFDNGNTVLRTPSYTTITTTVITLPTIDDEKVNDNEKSFTTTTTVTSVDVKSPTSKDVPDELNTRNSRSSVIFTTDSALEAKPNEVAKISGESFWSGDSKAASTAPQGHTMVMRDRNSLSGSAGVSGSPRPTSEFMSNRLANFQKEESVTSKPDKPQPAARPRLNVSQWESNLNTTQQPEGVVKRPEPARQGARVRNFLSHYETSSQSREEDVTNTKPLSSLEERLGKSLEGGKETEVKSKHEADLVKNETKSEIKPEIITPQESRLQDSPSDKADDGVRPKSEPTAATKPAPESNDTKDVTDGLILSRLSGSPRPKSPESRPVRPISPKPRSPRPSSPEVGQNGSQATTKDLSNGDSKPSGPSVSQLSKALGSKLTNLPGALGGMRPPNKEPPAVKPRPAPPTIKPKPEAPKARPRPDSLRKDSNGISEEDQNAGSSHGVILRVSRPEGAPHSELDLIPSTHLLDSSASKSRSRLSNCGGLKLRRKPTLNRGNQNSLITPKLQNGDSGEPTSTSPTMTHIPEHDDEVDHVDVKNDDVVVDNKISSSSHDVIIPAVDVSIKLEAAPILTETTPSLNKTTPTVVDTSLSSLEPVKTESQKKIEVDFDTKKNETIHVDKLIDTADVNIDIIKPVSSTHKEIEVEKKNDEILDITIPKSSNLEGSSIMDGPPEDAPPPLPSCPPPELDFDHLPGGKGGPGGAESAREEQMRRKYEFLGLSADQSEEYKTVKSSALRH